MRKRTSGQSSSVHCGRDHAQGRRIAALDAEEDRLLPAGGRPGAGEAEDQTEDGELQALAQDQCEHVDLLCPDGDAQTDLAGPPGHGVGEDAVQAEGGRGRSTTPSIRV